MTWGMQRLKDRVASSAIGIRVNALPLGGTDRPMGRTVASGDSTGDHVWTHDPRWHAVQARDATADDAFFYAVETTGVFCRPSCASRPARPANVSFHRTRESAEAAGFRPCKRCRPDLPTAEQRARSKVAALCHFIETHAGEPTLDELAAQAELSASRTQRLFKSVMGVTPKAYAAALRGRRVRAALADGRPVTEAIYEAGYSSSGRFYAQAQSVLGMTPSQFRDRGADTVIRFAVGQCSLGAVLVAATDRGVCAIELGDDPDALVESLQQRFANAELVGGDVGFEGLVARVIGLVEQPGPHALPLDLQGTAFQLEVWAALSRIGAGSTTTYAELAAAIGRPSATRAVAQACGANPVAVAIPCHRVVRTDGSASGYRWGVERKRELLAREV